MARNDAHHQCCQTQFRIVLAVDCQRNCLLKIPETVLSAHRFAKFLVRNLSPQGATMSFILIGFGKKTYKDLGETGQEQKCAWCSTRIFYHLIVIHTWLTCFFIPLLPYRKEYKIECPVCACGTWIYGKEVKAAKRGELSIHRYATTANE
jgi:hypothetical protein